MPFFKDVVLYGLIASRPTSGPTTGALFFASDTGAGYRWNGSSWDKIIPIYADDETPSGTVDGSNTAFTLANSPSPAASLRLYRNGSLQQRGSAKDYTLSGAAITFVTAPLTGDILEAFYRY